MMHGFYGYGYGFGHSIFMILGLFIIGSIIWGILKPSRCSSHRQHHTPIDIAKERYARGEITIDELNEIKRNL